MFFALNYVFLRDGYHEARCGASCQGRRDAKIVSGISRVPVTVRGELFQESPDQPRRSNRPRQNVKKSPAPQVQGFWSAIALLVQTETLVELGHTSAGIHQLLLAGEEGVTLRADFYANILLRRTCLNYITAGAFDSSLLIIGMDSFLHCSGSPLSGTKVLFTKATVILPLFNAECKCFLKKFLCLPIFAVSGQKGKE